MSEPSMVRVLVVDDEPSLRRLLYAVLRNEGWDVYVAATGAQAVALARKVRPHLMVLDVVLPDIDGVQVLKTLRAEGLDSMALFLSANSAVAARIRGIDAGGDDYVTKPFSVSEVVSRLHGLLRRSSSFQRDSADTVLTVGDLTLNVDAFRAERGGTAISLTATELSLLKYLMENVDRVLSREEIMEAVWGYDYGQNSNVVELYISYLRKKVDAGRDPLIHTVRRVGYVLRNPGDTA